MIDLINAYPKMVLKMGRSKSGGNSHLSDECPGYYVSRILDT
jgi:hypothetical protein